MKRKIIKQANQAYTLTLPIDWVRQNNLSEKSEIEVRSKGKNLFINSDNKVIGEKIKINLSGLGLRDIAVQINSLYARGVDEIEIKSDKDISSILIGILNQNVGFALIKQTDNVFLIKDIGGGNYENLDEIFKRVFQMTLLFYESAIKDVFGESKETLDNLNVRDKEVNKFALYLQRAINKMAYPDNVKGHILFTYSYALEQIGDEIHRLWSTDVNKKIIQSKLLREAIDMSYEGLGQAFDLYYGIDTKKIRKLRRMRYNIRKIASELKGGDNNTLKFINHAIRIIEQASDLSHLALMRD